MRDISLHLIDIIQNSITAGADKVTVRIDADTENDRLKITVSDNGTGMDEGILSQVTSPFTTTRKTRKVGLGIPLLKDSAAMTGGDLVIWSEKGKGTTLQASFIISSIDRIPIGNIAETITTVIMGSSHVDIDLLLSSKNGDFLFSTAEAKEKLGEVAITEYEVLEWIKDYINEGLKITFGGVLDEINS